MPLLKIETNQPAREDRAALLKLISNGVTQLLNKPESYVMVSLTHNSDMLFAGSNQPLAYLELKSISLPTGETGKLSKQLCTLINHHMKIPQERIYIEFSDAPRAMWGWNGATFER